MIPLDTPTLATLTFFISFFILVLAGVPLAVSLGLCSVIIASTIITIDPYLLIKAFYQPFQSFSLIAIYLFVAMGVIFSETGLTSLLIDLLYPVLGRKRYGLPFMVIIGSAIFGLLTGSAVATAGAFAGLLGGEMIRKKFPKEHALAVVSVAAPLGALIPPSIPALVLSVSTNTSVLTNFAVVGGIGILYTIILLIWEAVVVTRRKIGEVYKEDSTRKDSYLKNILKAAPIALVPIGVLGGIFMGLVSVSEAGAIGVIVSLLIAIAYRRLNLSTLRKIAIQSASTTAVVYFLISTSYMVSYVWSMSKVYVVLDSMLQQISVISVTLTLLVVEVILLIMGMFIDLIIFNITLAPVLATILRPMGISPYLVNGIFALGNLIGTVTPPVGTVLATACGALKIPLNSRIFKEVFFMLIPSIILYVLMVFIPDIALWLPKLLGLRL
ncbi:MAG: TRAP transporter large permease subunit [Desulfurococcaceae archaeon]